jgi:hypothetical protein
MNGSVRPSERIPGMFNFLRRSGPHELTATLRQALVDQGLPPGIDLGALSMVQQRGLYSGRSVGYSRVFSPAEAVQRGLQPRAFGDLDAHPELILGAGHVEHGGAIVLKRGQTRHAAPAMAGEQADLARHGDDGSSVFPSGTSA